MEHQPWKAVVAILSVVNKSRVKREKDYTDRAAPCYGSSRGHGYRKQTPGRLRSKEILENPNPKFGKSLLAQRTDIERYFGNLTNWGDSLSPLPSWIRSYRRVHCWVQAKLIINSIKGAPSSTTYVEE